MKKINEMKTYSASEFEDLRCSDAVLSAIENWSKACEKSAKKFGNIGTCVLGAGIAVKVRPPRCRNYRVFLLIPSYQVCSYQGSMIWEDSVDRIISQLNKAGVDCYYKCGRMD